MKTVILGFLAILSSSQNFFPLPSIDPNNIPLPLFSPLVPQPSDQLITIQPFPFPIEPFPLPVDPLPLPTEPLCDQFLAGEYSFSLPDRSIPSVNINFSGIDYRLIGCNTHGGGQITISGASLELSQSEFATERACFLDNDRFFLDAIRRVAFQVQANRGNIIKFFDSQLNEVGLLRRNL